MADLPLLDVDIFNMTDSWNNAAVIFNAIQMDVADTASDPNSNLLNLKIGGVSKANVRKDGTATLAGSLNALSVVSTAGNVQSANAVSAASGYWDAAFTTQWTPEATNVWAARNGLNPNTIRAYNTFTDTNNWERGFQRWNANIYEVGVENAGTGLARSFRLKAAIGSNGIFFSVAGSDQWFIDGTTGYFKAVTDNVFDIGAAGANRPRNLYIAGQITSGPLAVTGLSTLTGHIASAGTAVTAAAGANAGTAPPAPVVTAGATDTKGNVTFGTGTVPAAGAELAVTFAAAYATAPVVAIVAANAATQALGLYVTSTTLGFTVSAANAPTASQANTTYSVNYIVVQ